MILFSINLCFVLDISYLYIYLYTTVNMMNLYTICILCCTMLTIVCGILFIFIYIIICILNDRLLNSIIIITLITCLFLVCMLRFTSVSSNIILYIMYSIFITNISMFIFQFGYVIEKVYFMYLTFFVLSYCILYGILGILRILWSLLVMINLFLKVFIWVVVSHLYVDILFNSEYVMLQGMINAIVIIVSIDEFKHIYFIHSSFWIVLCMLCCIYCTLISIIYACIYVCISIFVLITICVSLTITDRVLSFFNVLLWSGVPIILISYFKLLCVIFIILVYNIIGCVACLITVIISFIIAAYLIMDNFMSSIFS